jgi:lipopolysaccharide transport system ATP-binding protein
VYLNGAILGMARSEIGRKFDEIVAFAEVEQFLDTPVKRYSSGMYLRLAFAVAAHLDPDILVVDEVLAVGDAQFQKKCLGKMREVSSSEGRTVLFVSHSMEAVARLCSRCLLFDRGRLIAQGDSTSVVRQYLAAGPPGRAGEWIDVTTTPRSGTGEARFTAVRYFGSQGRNGDSPRPDEPVEFQLQIDSDADRQVGSLAVVISDLSGIKLVNADIITLGRAVALRKGGNALGLRICNLHLNPGSYTVGLWLADPFHPGASSGAFDYVETACRIDVTGDGPVGDLGQRSRVTCDFELVDTG